MISGALDIGVAVLPTVDELLDHFVFVKEKLNLLVHPSHPLAGKESVALHELENDAFVLFREDFALHDRIIVACQHAGFQPRVVYESLPVGSAQRNGCRQSGCSSTTGNDLS